MIQTRGMLGEQVVLNSNNTLKCFNRAFQTHNPLTKYFVLQNKNTVVQTSVFGWPDPSTAVDQSKDAYCTRYIINFDTNPIPVLNNLVEIHVYYISSQIVLKNRIFLLYLLLLSVVLFLLVSYLYLFGNS